MKVRWTALSGEQFETSALHFENLVYREGVRTDVRADKTWKTQRGWSASFHTVVGSPTVSIIENKEECKFLKDNQWCFPAIEKTIWTVQGYEIARSYIFLDLDNSSREPKPYDIIGPSGVRYGHTGREAKEGPTFEIMEDNNVIFSSTGEFDSDDWKIIAELSGQRNRRMARISIAEEGGALMPHVLKKIGVHIPTLDYETVPLLEKDFQKSKNGGDYVVISFGKVMFSKTCTAGYYKVVHEGPKVKHIALIL